LANQHSGNLLSQQSKAAPLDSRHNLVLKGAHSANHRSQLPRGAYLASLLNQAIKPVPSGNHHSQRTKELLLGSRPNSVLKAIRSGNPLSQLRRTRSDSHPKPGQVKRMPLDNQVNSARSRTPLHHQVNLRLQTCTIPSLRA